MSYGNKPMSEAVKEFKLNEGGKPKTSSSGLRLEESKNPLTNPDRKDKKIEENKKGEAHLLGYLNELEKLLPEARKEIENKTYASSKAKSWPRLMEIILKADTELWYKQLYK